MEVDAPAEPSAKPAAQPPAQTHAHGPNGGETQATAPPDKSDKPHHWGSGRQEQARTRDKEKQ